MTKIAILPPDGADWTISPVPMEGGLVGLEIEFELSGKPVKLRLALNRPDSRELPRGILRAGGDATERSFTGGSGHGDG